MINFSVLLYAVVLVNTIANAPKIPTTDENPPIYSAYNEPVPSNETISNGKPSKPDAESTSNQATNTASPVSFDIEQTETVVECIGEVSSNVVTTIIECPGVNFKNKDVSENYKEYYANLDKVTHGRVIQVAEKSEKPVDGETRLPRPGDKDYVPDSRKFVVPFDVKINDKSQIISDTTDCGATNESGKDIVNVGNESNNIENIAKDLCKQSETDVNKNI